MGIQVPAPLEQMKFKIPYIYICNTYNQITSKFSGQGTQFMQCYLSPTARKQLSEELRIHQQAEIQPGSEC